MSRVNSFVGSPVERVEDLRFLRGQGQYVDDLPRSGLLHAAILRSPVAHGRLRAVDATAARALPGVHAVITAAEIGQKVPTIPVRLMPVPELEPFVQPVLAHDKVRYVGEPVAVVVAASPALAEDALEAIVLDIEALPAITDRIGAGADTTLLFEGAGSNLAVKYHAFCGDADAAFRDAPYTRRESFRVQRHTAVPMETRGLLAEWDAATGHLTVSGSTKVPFANRRVLAQQMGLPESAIDMMENDVGGGFGARGEFYPEDFLIPFAARLVNRSVKWIEDRREHLLTTNHARDADCEIEIACTRDGKILGLRGDAFVDLGAYVRTAGVIAPRNIGQFFSGPYRVPNIAIDVSVLMTNKTPSATYRGPGRFESDFFRERLFDIVAKDLGIDRIEFRRRNLVLEAEMPYELARIKPLDIVTELDSGDNLITLDRCLAEIGWAEKLPLQGKLIDGRYHGLGLGCFIEGGAAGPKENARMTLDADGSVVVHVGSSALGQGLETVFAQIAADALEMPLDQVRVLHGSTTLLDEGFGSYHSRSVVMGGSAMLVAAAKLRDAIRDAAARRLNTAPAEFEIADGLVVFPGGRGVALTELAAEGLSAEGSFANHHHTYAYGAHAAHVAVDPRTGHVAILDYVGVEDAGRIINPKTLHGQAIGAIVQGLGGTFLEHLAYDEHGQLLTGSFADYLLPTASDFPNIRAIMLELKPSPINPLGAKGAGEGGIIPVGGVIANAVASALSSLGVEPHELPLSPSNLWQLIETAKRAQ